MEQQLIKISLEGGKKTVWLKDLYERLGHNMTHWKRWYTSNILENSFAIQNEDWVAFTMMANGNETMDFQISIDFAKRIAMMAKTEKGEKIRAYFIKMEKVALQVFKPTPTIQEHAQRSTQVKNSKEVNSYQYEIGGVPSIMEYNKMNCKLHTGKFPKEIMKEAEKNKLPSKQRTSAKEVLRNTDPVTACSMSLTDDMVKMGGKLDEAVALSNTHGRAIFAYMLKNNMTPGELSR
jgi:phage anti-repressor protein